MAHAASSQLRAAYQVSSGRTARKYPSTAPASAKTPKTSAGANFADRAMAARCATLAVLLHGFFRHTPTTPPTPTAMKAVGNRRIRMDQSDPRRRTDSAGLLVST